MKFDTKKEIQVIIEQLKSELVLINQNIEEALRKVLLTNVLDKAYTRAGFPEGSTQINEVEIRDDVGEKLAKKIELKEKISALEEFILKVDDPEIKEYVDAHLKSFEQITKG